MIISVQIFGFCPKMFFRVSTESSRSSNQRSSPSTTAPPTAPTSAPEPPLRETSTPLCSRRCCRCRSRRSEWRNLGPYLWWNPQPATIFWCPRVSCSRRTSRKCGWRWRPRSSEPSGGPFHHQSSLFSLLISLGCSSQYFSVTG